MERAFVFVGDPGPDAALLLRALKTASVAARRCPPEAEAAEIEAFHPSAIVLAPEIASRDELIVAFRDRPALHQVPILARVRANDEAEIQQAFKEGADGFLLDGASTHFDALVVAAVKDDVWKTVRAPAGVVIVAHRDRAIRVRLARVLKRNGFDPHFAADVGELNRALDTVAARAILAEVSLPGEDPVRELIGRGKGPNGASPVWLILAPSNELDGLSRSMPLASNCRFVDEDSDPEASTFILNDLLSPEPPKQRRTPRLLYGATVAFAPEDASGPPFVGFTYNVNAGGMFIRALTPLPLQSRVRVTFRPPFGRGTVSMIAQVMWRKEFGDEAGAATPPGMGVQFVDTWPADLKGFEAGYQALWERSDSGRLSPVSLMPQSPTEPPKSA